MKSVTTIMNVNTRVGPGSVYDTKTQVRRGVTLEYDQTLKDGADIIWYHTNKGWISGRYASVAKDIKNKIKPEDKIMNLQNFDDDDDYEDEDDSDDEDDEDSDEDDEDDEGSWAEFKKSEDTNSGPSLEGIEDPGVSIATSAKDIILAKRIFGLPYQWLHDTDVPLNEIYESQMNDGELGYNYYEALMETPILSVIPGLPDFLPDASEDQKKSMTDYIDGLIKDIGNTPGDFGQRILDSVKPDDCTTRLFGFRTCYSRFARYFNTMCQMNAILMGLGNEVLPGFDANETNHRFKSFNWTAYTMANKYVGRSTNDEQMNDPNKMFDFSGTANQIEDKASHIWNALTGPDNAETGEKASLKTISDQYYTDFVINPRIGYTDELSNSAGQSMISNLFSGAQDMTKEIQFILDAAPGMADGTNALANKAGQGIKDLGNTATGVLGDVIKSISSSASTIVRGANLIFPEIWKSSNYQRNFNIEIKLSTPYGTPRNIFLDILVPMWFWICLTAPRQASANSYMSPFLVRCHVPGIFSVDNGLVSSLSIRKGGDDSAWSVDGFPLEVTLSLQITDLYHELSISSLNGAKYDDMWNFMWNDSLINYISVQSGLNMKSNEMALKAAVAANLVSDMPRNLIGRWTDTARETLGMLFNNLKIR